MAPKNSNLVFFFYFYNFFGAWEPRTKIPQKVLGSNLGSGSSWLQKIAKFIFKFFGAWEPRTKIPQKVLGSNLGSGSWWLQKVKKIHCFIFWGRGTKIASQDFLGDLGSWFPGFKKLQNYSIKFLEPGNQEPRSSRKTWGAILVPDPGGSKKLQN